MNRLTIIPIDNAIYVDDLWMNGFDLTFIPDDVHALQWKDDKGWIERKGQADEMIGSLPQWAIQCLGLWNERQLVSE